jgi:hypothetical protein
MQIICIAPGNYMRRLERAAIAKTKTWVSCLNKGKGGEHIKTTLDYFLYIVYNG